MYTAQINMPATPRRVPRGTITKNNLSASNTTINWDVGMCAPSGTLNYNLIYMDGAAGCLLTRSREAPATWARLERSTALQRLQYQAESMEIGDAVGGGALLGFEGDGRRRPIWLPAACREGEQHFGL